jgi:ABC-type transport system substrate-binding protein
MYKASLAIADQWKEAGINVKLEFMDWPSQIERAQSLKDWHVNQTGWSPHFDPAFGFAMILIQHSLDTDLTSFLYSRP